MSRETNERADPCLHLGKALPHIGGAGPHGSCQIPSQWIVATGIQKQERGLGSAFHPAEHEAQRKTFEFDVALGSKELVESEPVEQRVELRDRQGRKRKTLERGWQRALPIERRPCDLALGIVRPGERNARVRFAVKEDFGNGWVSLAGIELD